MHKLDEKVLITPALLARFADEAESGPYFAVLCRSDGTLIEHLQGPPPCIEQKMFAFDMVPALNKHLHHDGAWVLAFTHPPAPANVAVPALAEYQRFVLMWMDKDGDVQFPVECHDRFWEVLTKGPDYWIEQCEQAWKNWHFMMRDVLAPGPHQLYRRAMGETSLTSLTRGQTRH